MAVVCGKSLTNSNFKATTAQQAIVWYGPGLQLNGLENGQQSEINRLLDFFCTLVFHSNLETGPIAQLHEPGACNAKVRKILA